MSDPLSYIPAMDEPEFDEAAVRARWRRYGQMTDAEYILDQAKFKQAYGFAAHASARDVAALLAQVELLQAEVERERGKVGDLVRQLNDITRGQGEVWPAGASLPAGPPLPRRVPGESLKPCGWMGIEPMTDPALEDRAEGGES